MDDTLIVCKESVFLFRIVIWLQSNFKVMGRSDRTLLDRVERSCNDVTFRLVNGFAQRKVVASKFLLPAGNVSSSYLRVAFGDSHGEDSALSTHSRLLGDSLEALRL